MRSSEKADRSPPGRLLAETVSAALLLRVDDGRHSLRRVGSAREQRKVRGPSVRNYKSVEDQEATWWLCLLYAKLSLFMSSTPINPLSLGV